MRWQAAGYMAGKRISLADWTNREGEAMEPEEIREWLDRLIQNRLEEDDLRYFNSQISAVPQAYFIQLAKGIEIAAEAAGAELMEESTCTSDQKQKILKQYFTYRGKTFVQEIYIGEAEDE